MITDSTPLPDIPTVATSLVPYPPARARSRTLAAVVLLAGAVRPSDLQRCAGRPLLDLPVSRGQSLAGEWMRRMQDFRGSLGGHDLPLVVTANSISGAPREISGAAGVSVRMDSEEPRGSGGALRDLAIDHDPGTYLLVASGHALPTSSLAATFARLDECDDDIMIHTDGEHRPTGFFLIRCGTLTGLPAKGFVDLKEQALPQLAARFRVRVVCDASPAPIPIRSLHGFVSAVRTVAGGRRGATDSLAEDWMCTFTLTEEGAMVDPTARLHDSVVLRGGRVGAGASVVRSLVGPGGVVAAGSEVFDEFVPGSDQRP